LIRDLSETYENPLHSESKSRDKVEIRGCIHSLAVSEHPVENKWFHKHFDPQLMISTFFLEIAASVFSFFTCPNHSYFVDLLPLALWFKLFEDLSGRKAKKLLDMGEVGRSIL